MQNINGKFAVTFRGFILLSFSKTELTSERGDVALVYAIHLTPLLAFGFVWAKR